MSLKYVGKPKELVKIHKSVQQYQLECLKRFLFPKMLSFHHF